MGKQPPAREASKGGETGAVKNLLKKKRDLLGRLSFRTSLPDLPFDPKLLDIHHEPSRLFSYRPTTLEQNYKPLVHAEANLGISIDLIDPDAYRPPTERPTLTESDRELLSFRTRKEESRRGDTSGLTWLRRTEYISSHDSFVGNNQVESVGAQRAAAAVQKLQEQEALDTLEAQIQSIQDEFEAAAAFDSGAGLTHPTNPDATPVSVHPFLPDFETWPNRSIYLVFDDDPNPSSEPRFSYAILHSSRRAEEKKPLGAYLVPKSNGESSSVGTSKEAKTQEEAILQENVPQEYEWMREYVVTPHWSFGQKTQPYVIVEPSERTGAGEPVVYKPLTARANLSKFKPRGGADDPLIDVVVTNRALATAEARERHESWAQLYYESQLGSMYPTPPGSPSVPADEREDGDAAGGATASQVDDEAAMMEDRPVNSQGEEVSGSQMESQMDAPMDE